MRLDHSSCHHPLMTALAALALTSCAILDAIAQDAHPPTETIEDLRQPRPPASERSIEWRTRIKQIIREHFASGHSRARRDDGLNELREINDPAAFQPMLELLHSEEDDVRLVMLEHFLANGEAGQAALAWAAVYWAAGPQVERMAPLRVPLVILID